jgi:hypothetical protein
MNAVTPHEQHPISHGSWEHRYKVSITNDRIRFTLNTSGGIKDLDSETQILPGQWYHLAVVYDGEDMEIWIDGQLDAFAAHSGSIGISPVQPVLGQNIPGNNQYNFHGALSMLHIFDYALSPLEIQDNLSLNVIPVHNDLPMDIWVYPNPVLSDRLNLRASGNIQATLSYQILDTKGQVMQTGNPSFSPRGDVQINLPSGMTSGMYFIKLLDGGVVRTGRFVVLR